MATFNGERYLAEQVTSILSELGPDDELVVVEDCSTDSTPALLRSFGDPRIKVYDNDRNRGVNYSFGRALSVATGGVIFMSDQDDRWIAGRVRAFIDVLRNTGALVASSNSAFMDGEGKQIAFPIEGVRAADASRHFTNIVGIFTGRTVYYGCAMAMRKRLLDLVLPIPAFVESHDLWIAMAGNLIGANAHLEQETLWRRVHGGNASIVRRSLARKLWSRVIFGVSLIHLTWRALKHRGRGWTAQA